MATIFPREEKAEMLFDKILANPEACRRLKRTFYDAIDSGDEFVTENLPAKQFTAALFDAYENKAPDCISHGCVPKQYVRSFKKCFSDTV